MKYDQTTKSLIVQLHKDGLTSRQIARELNISKSGVNDFLNKYFEDLPTKNYFLLDIEVAPDTVVTHRRYDVSHTQDAVIHQGGYILSYAIKRLNAREPSRVISRVLSPEEAKAGNDYYLAFELKMLLERADVVIHHNGDKYDIPVIRSRLAVHNLGGLHRFKTIDTLKLARQMKFQSNKLGDLGVILGVGEKLKHDGIALWAKCKAGDEEALQTLLEYNEQDVHLLEAVYNKLAPVAKMPFSAGLFAEDDNLRCPSCGSKNTKVSETILGDSQVQFTSAGKYQEHFCYDCGSTFRDKQNVLSRDKRKNLGV